MYSYDHIGIPTTEKRPGERYGPHEPLPGYRSVFIEECGAPVEFIETQLSQEEIIGRANQQSQIDRTA